MDLYLQLGYGMMGHCKHFVQSWGNGTVILSPRDLTPEQIPRFSTQILDTGGKTLLDPQLYDPRATFHRLAKHDYWPDDFSTGMLLGGPELALLLERLKELNDSAGTEAYLIPGIYCGRVDDDWLTIQEAIIMESESVFSDKKRFATICLSAEALRFEDQIEILLNCSESWNVDGYYLVPEHPADQYLVDDPMWLANLLILSAGLKLQDREVIIGYCSHQLLCLATANVDAIASGTWLNVRVFSTEKFQQPPDDSGGRPPKAKWYYCPQALSEYRLAFLDMAFSSGVLGLLKADESMDSDYADILFSGAQPSATAYAQPQSCRHYLQCLRVQCRQARKKSFRETVNAHLAFLDDAEGLIEILHRYGVRGQGRDFADIVDVNRSALTALVDSRGFVLDRMW